MAFELLEYLINRPDSQDTLEGILEWWVLDHDRERQPRQVREAVQELMGEGYLLVMRGRDHRDHYHLNLARREEAERVVRDRRV